MVLCVYSVVDRTDAGEYCYKCIYCDHVRYSKYPGVLLHHNCPKSRGMVNSSSKLSRYARAVNRWIKAGRPLRSDDRIREVFNESCLPCEWFNKTAKSCRVCGCQVHDADDKVLGGIGNLIPAVKGLTNKLAMATESCPKGKWKSES